MEDRAPGLTPLDLAMACVQGLAGALVAVPLTAWAAEAVAPVWGAWPVGPEWLAWQWSAATLAACTLLCALGPRRRDETPRTRLRDSDRSLLIATAMALGLGVGFALASIAQLAPSARLCLALAAAIAAAAWAGGLLWRGDLVGGATLGAAASLQGLLGGIGAAAFSHAARVVFAPDLSPGLSVSLGASATLAGACVACYLGAQAISSTDPLVGHSVLERPGNPG
jgi:hypothetical protein